MTIQKMTAIWYGVFLATLALFFVVAWLPEATSNPADTTFEKPKVVRAVSATEILARLDRCILQPSNAPLIEHVEACDTEYGFRTPVMRDQFPVNTR